MWPSPPVNSRRATACLELRALATRLRVNPATVVQAYRELEQEKLVEMRQGAGTYILEMPADSRARERQAAAKAAGARPHGRRRAARHPERRQEGAQRRTQRGADDERRNHCTQRGVSRRKGTRDSRSRDDGADGIAVRVSRAERIGKRPQRSDFSSACSPRTTVRSPCSATTCRSAFIRRSRKSATCRSGCDYNIPTLTVEEEIMRYHASFYPDWDQRTR